SLSAAYHLFHMHLDIRWWSLTLFYIITTTWGSQPVPHAHPRVSLVLISEPRIASNEVMADSEKRCVLEQCLSAVLWDLVTIICRESFK
ncbi:hypothetical protein SK128_027969, partial [Halocaridina rubra]